MRFLYEKTFLTYILFSFDGTEEGVVGGWVIWPQLYQDQWEEGQGDQQR